MDPTGQAFRSPGSKPARCGLWRRARRDADVEGLSLGQSAFVRRDDVLFCSGLIDGHVALRGPLSNDQITVGVGLRMGGGTRHWLEETASGAVGVFLGGDEHDAFYAPGSLYATATLSLDRLEQLAAGHEYVLDRPALGGTGLHPRPLATATLKRLRHAFALIHAGSRDGIRDTSIGQALLRALIAHLGRAPRVRNRAGRTDVQPWSSGGHVPTSWNILPSR